MFGSLNTTRHNRTTVGVRADEALQVFSSSRFYLPHVDKIDFVSARLAGDCISPVQE